MVKQKLINLITEDERAVMFGKCANNSNAWFDKTRSNYLCAITLFEKYKETYENAIQDSKTNGSYGKWPALLDFDVAKGFIDSYLGVDFEK